MRITLFDSYHMKFQKKQNESMASEVKMVATLGEVAIIRQEYNKVSKILILFCFLI